MNLIGSGESADVYSIGHGRVVKLFYDGHYSIDEYNACKYMGDMTSFAPQVFKEVTIDGKKGFEMEELIGQLLIDVIDESSDIRYYAELMGKAHKDLHDWDSSKLELPQLKVGLTRYLASLKHLEKHLVDWGLELLKDLEDGRSLLHGDFMPYNLMYLDDTLKMMDWSDAMLGPGVADIARSLFFIINPNDYEDSKYTLESNIFIEAYLNGYYGNEPVMDELQKWLIINVIIELDGLLASNISNNFTKRLRDYLNHNYDEMGSDYLFE